MEIMRLQFNQHRLFNPSILHCKEHSPMVFRYMINRFFFTFGLIVACLGAAGGAYAQECDVDYEQLVKLHEANLGSYNIWDTVLGERDIQERFKSAVVLESGNVLAVGERFGAKDAPAELLLAEIKKNGRPAWQKIHGVAGLKNIIKMLPNSKGVAVLANRSVGKDRLVLWFGVFDAEGALLSQKEIKASGSLEAFDIARMADGKSYMIATSARGRPSDAAFTKLYIVNEAGGVRFDKSIVTGFENRVMGLDVLPTGEVLATGFITDDNQRKSGWVTFLNSAGDIVWQRQYPRGAGAQLEVGMAYKQNLLLVAGTALPLDMAQNRGAWVMVIDAASGAVGWQRFYTGSLGYVARDMMLSNDGLISVLVDGETPLNPDNRVLGQQEHVRLLTLSPRGVLFESDEYFNGEGVDAYQLLPGPNNERILVGGSDMAYKMESGEEGVEPEIIRGEDAWLAAGTAMELYDDPCVVKQRVLP